MKYQFKSDEELKLFISDNIITTMEAAAILNCSRQNIDKMVKGNKLIPVKQTQRDKLFLKSDVMVHIKT
ncbi:helix-turn-helix domain-containing protein [Pelosinus baikalensis]|uniref:Helix-turn-helix domain-containing protein n=1 Tax=Pelosinus baikalensis TaxID=2892015 RepID=A0ABS8HQV8_9FIRM|nr:helix-turn-helix domain-containing protein [Pelosinus baikalensis]MCC5465558.1 helix-turn-helix domain-containing protein [Pelosinus baikalensis]